MLETVELLVMAPLGGVFFRDRPEAYGMLPDAQSARTPDTKPSISPVPLKTLDSVHDSGRSVAETVGDSNCVEGGDPFNSIRSHQQRRDSNNSTSAGTGTNTQGSGYSNSHNIGKDGGGEVEARAGAESATKNPASAADDEIRALRSIRLGIHKANLSPTFAPDGAGRGSPGRWEEEWAKGMREGSSNLPPPQFKR